MGFWPRFLAAWPAPSAPGHDRPWRADHDATIGAYWGRCTEMMAVPLGEDCGRLAVLEMTPEALRPAGASGPGERRVPCAIEVPTRSTMRGYRLLIGMGEGQDPKQTTLFAPPCGLEEARRIAALQFGAERVIQIDEHRA